MSERSWSREPGSICHRIGMWSEPRSSCSPPGGCPTKSSRHAWIHPARSSVSGENGSSRSASAAWKNNREAGAQPAFPPSVIDEVTALPCELPHRYGLPLVRFTLSELRHEVIRPGDRRLHQRNHAAALVDPGRPPFLAPPQLALPPRPLVRREGRAGPGALCGRAGGRPAPP